MASSYKNLIRGQQHQRDLFHLKPPVRNPKRHSRAMPAKHFVHPEDRIAFWNIAPGDEVRVTVGPEGQKGMIGKVSHVERELNRVFLEGSTFARRKISQSMKKGEVFEADFDWRVDSRPRPIHYSNCQLVIGRTPAGEPILGTRLKRSKVSWDPRQRSFRWSRYPTKVQVLRRDPTSGKEYVEDYSDSASKVSEDKFAPVPFPTLTRPFKRPPEDGLIASPAEATKNTFSPASEDTLANLTASLSKLTTDALPPVPFPFSVRTKVSRLAAQRDQPPLDIPPELLIPATEFGGGYDSRAQRTRRHNIKKVLEEVSGGSPSKGAKPGLAGLRGISVVP